MSLRAADLALWRRSNLIRIREIASGKNQERPRNDKNFLYFYRSNHATQTNCAKDT
jgi:hypothetical protein